MPYCRYCTALVTRKDNGEEDTYAFACALADQIFFPPALYKNKDNNEMKYRTFCLPDMERTRTDKSSLEFVIWRMTQQKYSDRLHDINEMRKLISGITHVDARA